MEELDGYQMDFAQNLLYRLVKFELFVRFTVNCPFPSNGDQRKEP